MYILLKLFSRLLNHVLTLRDFVVVLLFIFKLLLLLLLLFCLVWTVYYYCFVFQCALTTECCKCALSCKPIFSEVMLFRCSNTKNNCSEVVCTALSCFIFFNVPGVLVNSLFCVWALGKLCLCYHVT